MDIIKYMNQNHGQGEKNRESISEQLCLSLHKGNFLDEKSEKCFL